jgi:hypothetical protein
MRYRTSAAVAALSLLLVLTVAAPAMAADFPAKDSRYHNYAEMVAALDDAVADHPDIVRKFSIGKSYQGRDIWGQDLGQRR